MSQLSVNSFLSVVVITCASHAQGRRFEPGRKQSLCLTCFTFCHYDKLTVVVGCITRAELNLLMECGDEIDQISGNNAGAGSGSMV